MNYKEGIPYRFVLDEMGGMRIKLQRPIGGWKTPVDPFVYAAIPLLLQEICIDCIVPLPQWSERKKQIFEMMVEFGILAPAPEVKPVEEGRYFLDGTPPGYAPGDELSTDREEPPCVFTCHPDACEMCDSVEPLPEEKTCTTACESDGCEGCENG